MEMTKRERYKKIASLLEHSFPKAEFELHFESTYQLFVAIILATRCTDKLVNETTPSFFAKYPSVYELAQATEEELIRIIKSISFPETKARHIIKAAKTIVFQHGGSIPNNQAELLQITGIGQKSANTILAEGFGIPAIAVDTHIARVSQRTGLSSQTLPEKIENDLINIIPKEKWITDSHRLILLGRYICTSQSPMCDKCPIQLYCTTRTPEKANENLLF